MIHALAYVVFAFLSAAWLRYELKRTFSLRTHSKWVIAAFLFGLLGSLLSEIVGGVAGNFLLHGVGGGMASSCLFMYMARSLGLNLNWRLELVSLFLFVSTLGVLNELAEYVIELAADITMSFDSQDTWRDFVANTMGAMIVWLLIKGNDLVTNRKK